LHQIKCAGEIELFGGELRLYLTSTLYKLLGSQPFYTPAPGFKTKSLIGCWVGTRNLTNLETIRLEPEASLDI